MMNQVKKWNQCGVGAVALMDSFNDVQRGIAENRYSLVFASPESLSHSRWRELLQKKSSSISLIAVDEVHCLIQWGESFRKSYREVSLLRSLLTDKAFLLLTATCTEPMRKEICNELLLDAADINMVSVVPDRPNVYLN